MSIEICEKKRKNSDGSESTLNYKDLLDEDDHLLLGHLDSSSIQVTPSFHHIHLMSSY